MGLMVRLIGLRAVSKPVLIVWIFLTPMRVRPREGGNVHD
jgi:hypothetical protein